jgi:hypothetical protein
MNSVHFSSRTDLWETPRDLFAALEREAGGFDIDVCALSSNAKCAHYFTPEMDDLLSGRGQLPQMNADSAFQ